ncbi:MAG TPA: hypothetical protein VJK02_11325 [Anaerolineales bacterium]|nr:hypothetical protein [Anaerolineales bacterium]
MVLLSLVPFIIAASAGIFVYFSSLARPTVWRSAAVLSFVIAVIRTASCLTGRLILQNQSNWLQIPAYFMALASLPEAALVSRLPDSSIGYAFLLGAVTLLGTSTWIFVIGAIANARGRRPPGP